jgi:hypothetical protein
VVRTKSSRSREFEGNLKLRERGQSPERNGKVFRRSSSAANLSSVVHHTVLNLRLVTVRPPESETGDRYCSPMSTDSERHERRVDPENLGYSETKESDTVSFACHCPFDSFKAKLKPSLFLALQSPQSVCASWRKTKVKLLRSESRIRKGPDVVLLEN